ncbi:MAG: hypothetical protein ACI8V2_000684 [Candidatus Latescibacterota bacterium]|jgi:hypothetical protein
MLMAVGLHFSRYKRRGEDSDECLTCPIRTLLNLQCKKDHKKDMALSSEIEAEPCFLQKAGL